MSVVYYFTASRNINDWWLSYWISHSEIPGQAVTNKSALSLLAPPWYVMKQPLPFSQLDFHRALIFIAAS